MLLNAKETRRIAHENGKSIGSDTIAVFEKQVCLYLETIIQRMPKKAKRILLEDVVCIGFKYNTI